MRFAQWCTRALGQGMGWFVRSGMDAQKATSEVRPHRSCLGWNRLQAAERAAQLVAARTDRLAESTSAASTRHRSVVAQSIHGSVIDMPYLSDARSVSGWLPAPMLLSSIRPIIARLPLATW